MERLDWSYSTDFNAGAYTATQLDTTVNLSPYGHPAVVPLVPTFAAAVLGSTIKATPPSGYVLSNGLGYGANQWTTFGTAIATNLAGDQMALTTTANQVRLQFTGYFPSGLGGHSGDTSLISSAIRMGAVANILVDGVVNSSVDCYNTAPLTTLFLDGNSHVVTVVHSGSTGVAGSPISAITAVTGTSVSAALSVVPTTPSSCLDALYTITALTSSTYKVHVLTAGGVSTDVYASLSISTPTSVPGQVSGSPAFTINVNPSGLLVPGDVATFITSSTFIGLSSVQLGSTGTSNPGTYTSQVIDATDPQTQWFEADFTEGAPLTGSFTLHVGNTPTPDGSWTSVTVTPVDTLLPDTQVYQGVSGLSTLPRARYGQWSFTFGAATATQKWIRDVSIYYWVPELDKNIALKLAVGYGAVMQPFMLNVLGLLTVHLTDARQAALALIASYSISTAKNQYLEQYGTDLGLPRFSSEPPEAYATRLTTAFRSLPQGGSVAFIARLVNELATGVNVTPVLNTTLNSATCGQTVVTQGAGQQLQIVVAPAGAIAPNTGYAGFPNLPIATAQQIITSFIANTLVPAGAVINPGNIGTYNITFL